MMNRTFTLSALVLTSTTWAGAAAADPVVQGLTLGVERVFGLTATTTTEEEGEVTETLSVLGVSLGSAGGTTTGAGYSFPRVAGDYTLPMGLSFGTAFGVANYALEDEADGGLLSATTESSVTRFLFAPRVGYQFGFNENFGLWPRAGFTYVYQSLSATVGDNDIDSSASYAALTFETPLVFSPNKFFGFVATPALDLGVAASSETNGEEDSGDVSVTEFGITLGLFVAL